MNIAEKRKESKRAYKQKRGIVIYHYERTGIEKYFIPDPDNPVDNEIMQYLSKKGTINCYIHRCREAIRFGLQLVSYNPQRVNLALLERCASTGKTRNEVVRELLCTKFNIKIDE